MQKKGKNKIKINQTRLKASIPTDWNSYLELFSFSFPLALSKIIRFSFRNRTKSLFYIFHTYQKNIFYFSWIMTIISSWFLRIIHKLFNLMIIVNFLSSWILNFIIFEFCMSSSDNIYNFCILAIILFLSFGLKTTIYLVGTYKFFFLEKIIWLVLQLRWIEV